MKSLILAASFSVVFASVMCAAPLPVTPYTVIARVTSFEHYAALRRAPRFSSASPYGNGETIIATILQPASLAGREVAIPFESKKNGEELLVQRGTVFRFEHRMNLSDLRDRTDMIKRRAIEFPALGIFVLKADGEVAEAYAGALTRLHTDALKKKTAAAR